MATFLLPHSRWVHKRSVVVQMWTIPVASNHVRVAMHVAAAVLAGGAGTPRVHSIALWTVGQRPRTCARITKSVNHSAPLK